MCVDIFCNMCYTAFMKRKYLECGKIINTHGVMGNVKVDPLCDSPEILTRLDTVWFAAGAGFTPKKVLRASVLAGRFVLMSLDGVDSIDAAIQLKETMIFADREDIPRGEGDRFIADLIGMPVTDVDSGRLLGTLKEVFNSGASDIYVVETEAGDRMIPAVEEFVVRIDDGPDGDEGIRVRPIEGMFD